MAPSLLYLMGKGNTFMSNLNRVTIFTLLSTLALFSADTIAQRSRQVQKQTKQVENKKIEPKKVATNQGKNETLKKKLTKPKKQLSKKDSTIADTLTPNRLGIRPGSDTIGLTEGHLDSSAPETEKSNTQINQNDYADTTGLFVREQYIEKQMPLDSVSNALTNADFENLCNKINVSQEDRLPFIEGFYYQPLQLGNYLHSGSGHSQTRYSNESEDTRKNIDSYIAKQLKKNPQFETLVKKVAVDLVNFLKDDNRPEALNNIARLQEGSATFLHHCLVGSSPVKALHGSVVNFKLNLL